MDNFVPSSVSVVTNPTGETDVVVTGEHGSLTLRFSTKEGPTVVVPDLHRQEGKYKLVCQLMANGKLEGFFVERTAHCALDAPLVFMRSEHSSVYLHRRGDPEAGAPPRKGVRK